MCYPGVSGPGRSSRQERLQTSTPAHFRKLPFGLRNRGSWLLCQSKTIWLISISIRRQQIYTLEDNLSRSNTGLAWVESLGAGWLEWGSGPIPSVPESGPRLFHLCLSFSLLSQLQSTLPIPTSPPCHLYQYQSHHLCTRLPPPHRPYSQTLSESLISPCVKNKPYISEWGENQSLLTLWNPWRSDRVAGREGGGVFGTSVFPLVTCCLFDFVLSQDKH